jgi:hypothetical protein
LARWPRRVDATSESPADGAVAYVASQLVAGHDPTPRDDDFGGAGLFLADGAGFIVHPRAFANAERSIDGQALRIEHSADVILIERAAERLRAPIGQRDAGGSTAGLSMPRASERLGRRDRLP